MFQEKLIYFPDPEYTATPADLRLAYEEVTLTTDDGVRIVGWFVPSEPADATILYCHGNAGNISDRLLELKTLHRQHFSTFIFDYRGYGHSEGSPGEEGTYRDARAAWQYLVEQRGIQPGRIVIFGRSLGGAVAIQLATEVNCGALVVESTFTRMADVAKVHYPLLPARLILRHRYESIDKVGRVACPKLFMHGEEDSLIPIALGRALYAAAAQPARFQPTPGDHNNSGFTFSEHYTRIMAAFIHKALDADAPPPGGAAPATTGE